MRQSINECSCTLEIGDDITVEIEVINAGKNPALIENIKGIVAEGLKLQKIPIPYGLKKNYLNMKDPRFNPMKTEGLKLDYRSSKKGNLCYQTTNSLSGGIRKVPLARV